MFKKPKPLKEPHSVDHGYEYAIFLLSLRLRTEGEIRAKMRERGYAAGVIEHVLQRLFDMNYLDDRKFAEVFVDNMKRFKHYGYQMIKQKMYQKKLDKLLIEEVLKEQLAPDDELAIARRFLEKEFPLYLTDKAKFSYQDKQKIAHRLQARGFRGQVIAQVIRF